MALSFIRKQERYGLLNSQCRLDQRKTILACLPIVSRTLASQQRTDGHALEAIWAEKEAPGWASRAAGCTG